MSAPLYSCKACIICLVVAVSCGSCHPRSGTKSPEVRSFYYWKSVFSLSGKDRAYLHALHVNQLYVRFFDVTWDAEHSRTIPSAQVRFNDPSYRNYPIIPVVFISNEVLARLDTTAIGPLAIHIGELVEKLREGSSLPKMAELQMDCDWTSGTRDRYFSLLTDIRRWLDNRGLLGCQLSATIRLYQCKYRRLTGVPPVSKGLLMCYNMGDLKNDNTGNSILECATLEKYTYTLSSYPLPLDVALPIFNWKVFFHRGRYSGLVEALPAAALHNDAILRSGNLYTFRRDTSLYGYSFDAGDQLRDEQSSYEELSKAARLITRELKRPPGSVLFFHLDSVNLSNYKTDELENIYSVFD